MPRATPKSILLLFKMRVKRRRVYYYSIMLNSVLISHYASFPVRCSSHCSDFRHAQSICFRHFSFEDVFHQPPACSGRRQRLLVQRSPLRFPSLCSSDSSSCRRLVRDTRTPVSIVFTVIGCPQTTTISFYRHRLIIIDSGLRCFLLAIAEPSVAFADFSRHSSFSFVEPTPVDATSVFVFRFHRRHASIFQFHYFILPRFSRFVCRPRRLSCSGM